MTLQYPIPKWAERGIELLLAAALTMLLLSGCQWAKFREDWSGPHTKASSSGGDCEFIKVGEGEWTGPDGQIYRQDVYILRRKVRGARGPEGARGPTGKRGTVKITKPVPLEALAEHGTFDANSGSYHRRITVVKPPWGGDAATAIKVVPFEAKRVAGTPSYRSGRFAIGEGDRGAFTGGGFSDWKDAVRSGPVVLMVMGGLAILVGVVIAIWAGRVVLGLAVAGAGFALIATAVLFELYPWIVLIALAAVLGLGVWWFIDAKGLVKTKTALQTVVAGVQKAENGAAEAVKAAVAEEAKKKGVETVVRAVVSKAKNGT